MALSGLKTSTEFLPSIRFNAATGLARYGDERAIPVEREVAEQQDQQRRHQRTAADAGHTNRQTDEQAGRAEREHHSPETMENRRAD